MKKFFAILFVASLAFTACNKEADKPVDGKEVKKDVKDVKDMNDKKETDKK